MLLVEDYPLEQGGCRVTFLQQRDSKLACLTGIGVVVSISNKGSDCQDHHLCPPMYSFSFKV